MRFFDYLARGLAAGLLLTLAAPIAAQQPTCGVIHARSPPPKGYVCGTAGILTKAKPVISTKTGQTFAACRDACYNDKQCASFSFASKTCKLYKYSLITMGFKASKSGVVYYARNCFTDSCTCPSPTSYCNGMCAYTEFDDTNCGGCNIGCPYSTHCKNYQCQCPDGSTPDLQTDNNNCGSCGFSCGGGSTCLSGNCQCDANSVHPSYCSDSQTCVDLTSDEANCGSCSNTCPYGGSCDNGNCECPQGTSNCNGTCTDLARNSSNCGACGNQCADGLVCSNSQCVCPDPSDVYCNGGCFPSAAFQTDRNNCGSCGNACNALATCYAGACYTPAFYLVTSGDPAFLDDGVYLKGVDQDGGNYNNVGFNLANPALSVQRFYFDETTGYLTNDDGNRLSYNTFSASDGKYGVTLSSSNYYDSIAPLVCSISQSSPAMVTCNYNDYSTWRAVLYQNGQYLLEIATYPYSGYGQVITLTATTTPPS